MTKTIFVAACAFALTATASLAADVDAGKKKAAEACAACHGEDGTKLITPDTPILAGQYADYLEHALRLYRKGARQNPMMTPMAQPLTDEDIRNLAAFFSQQTGLQVRY
jgi:cytochrome c553